VGTRRKWERREWERRQVGTGSSGNEAQVGARSKWERGASGNEARVGSRPMAGEGPSGNESHRRLRLCDRLGCVEDERLEIPADQVRPGSKTTTASTPRVPLEYPRVPSAAGDPDRPSPPLKPNENLQTKPPHTRAVLFGVPSSALKCPIRTPKDPKGPLWPRREIPVSRPSPPGRQNTHCEYPLGTLEYPRGGRSRSA
jgi:hypothetical protein